MGEYLCDICLTGRGCTRCTTQVGWNWGTTRYTFDQMVAALSVYLHKYKDWPSTPHGFIVGEASGRANLELRVLPGVVGGQYPQTSRHAEHRAAGLRGAAGEPLCKTLQNTQHVHVYVTYALQGGAVPAGGLEVGWT